MSILKTFFALFAMCVLAWVTPLHAADNDTVKVGNLVQSNLPGEASLNFGL
ncbi:hypothetical protein [Vibrio sp. YT-19(2023)]|uniref:hypothetical protein n=1 Tax=Vibrio sp. YT-19(2023) TaxID=3074710 RepID=UPI002964CAA0|nr:hypothetical protein [Vibrio sp. YT-19(2023)]MDW1502410.1 hypothetical protein [Vibrio sp. YT-19(2023)]